MAIIVANCGMAGSGKSEVTSIFEEKSFIRIHFGSTEETIKRFGVATEEKEREVRLELRQKYGMGAMVIVALEKIKSLLMDGKNVVIDNMYSWSEYKILKEEFGKDFFTIAIHAKPELRYERLATRAERPRDTVTSKKRDYDELEELEKGGPIAMGDYNIINESTTEELRKNVEKIYSVIMN